MDQFSRLLNDSKIVQYDVSQVFIIFVLRVSTFHYWARRRKVSSTTLIHSIAGYVAQYQRTYSCLCVEMPHHSQFIVNS